MLAWIKEIRITVILAGLFLASCSRDELKIGETLAYLHATTEMADNSAPNIQQFADVHLYVKREGKNLKWKLVIESKKYKLAEALAYRDTSNGDAYSTARLPATFIIKFLDVDGFSLHEAIAGDSRLVHLMDTSKPNSPEGAEPVVSKDSYKDEVSYFGTIQASDEDINKINEARITCLISEYLKNSLTELVRKEVKK